MKIKNIKRDFEKLPVAVNAETAPSDKTLGRLVALALVLFGALVMAAGLSSCEPEYDDEPDSEWYLNGVWANNSYPDENMVFSGDGTGYWESVSTGDYLEFDYYCYNDGIVFTFYPLEMPPYSLSCYINLINGGTMSISWPGDSFYGPVTILYTRID